MRLRHETYRLCFDPAKMPIQAVRIGAIQMMILRAEIGAMSLGGIDPDVDSGEYAGIRFWTDWEFDGFEVEYLEDAWRKVVVPKICAAADLPCRTIS